MKKKQVNSILVNQAKRRETVISYTIVILILLLIGVLLLRLYLNDSKVSYVEFNESSSIDYQVYLKDNDYYGVDYLEKDNQYIASLIDHITSEISYRLNVEEEDIDYTYSYVLSSTVTVTEKSTNKNIYESTEVLDEESYIDANSNKDTIISKNVEIDYNYYNDLITKFVNVYDLDNVDSTLTISLDVTILGNCGDIGSDNNESVISLSIPLTTNTVGIDITENLIDESDQLIKVCSEIEVSFVLLIVGMAFLIMDLIVIYLLAKYIINTRTAETIYERELKKILNSYKSYIQKVNTPIDLEDFDVIKIDTFTDMLEIRDTISSPILMTETTDSKGVIFCIPSNTKLLYAYTLKVCDIEKKLSDERDEKER